MSVGLNLVWKVAIAASAAVGGMVIRRALPAGWKLVTGKEPPTQPHHPDTPWPQAFAWVLVSTVANHAVALLVTRGIARYWRSRTGELPPLPQLVRGPHGMEIAKGTKKGS